MVNSGVVMSFIKGLFGASFALCLVSTARSEWTVSVFGSSAPLGLAYANGSDGFVAAGYDDGAFGSRHAGIWFGGQGGFIDLHPEGYSRSQINGAGEGRQVGQATTGVAGAEEHAILWDGTSTGFVDLSPSWSPQYSVGFDTSFNQQVGISALGEFSQATMWTGTAASAINLHPVGFESSVAHATDGTNQAGSAWNGFGFSAFTHAGRWSGSAASWVDLHPASGAIFSTAYAISGSQTGGLIRTTEGDRAVLWNADAESMVNLHPDGTGISEVSGMVSGYQVGRAVIGGHLQVGGAPGTWIGGSSHAYVWQGSAGSAFDLHTLLPATFTGSVASDVSLFLGNVYITGYGYNVANARIESFIIQGPANAVPEPASLAVLAAGAAALLRRKKKTV